MKMKSLVITAGLVLAGCSSQASRMAECENQGVSKDACYVAEQNRQASINSTAQKQAMENAQALYPVQKAQAAKKTWKYDGMKIQKVSTGLNIDGKPAAIDEDNTDATTYSQGSYQFVLYKKSGILAVLKDGKFVEYAK